MPVEFGLDFFPDMRPSEKSGQEYFAETLRIAQECEALGSSRIKIVEHYFHPYGGYSPNPVVYLSAAAAITKKQRLMTGYLEFSFRSRSRTLRAERWGLANVVLKDAHLLDWYGYQNRNRLSRYAYDYQETEVK